MSDPFIQLEDSFVLLMEIEFWLSCDWHTYKESIDCLEYHNNFMCVMSFSFSL